MDFDQFFSFLQPSLDSSTVDKNYASQGDTLAVQTLPQPSCSNQSLALLNAFCSDEDTVKSYLLDGNELDNRNNEGQQSFDSPIGTLHSFIENWFSFNDLSNPSDDLVTSQRYLLAGNELNNQNNGQFFDSQTYDYYIENCLNLNDQTNQSHGLWTVENLSPSQNIVSSSITTDLSADLWSKINDEKFNLKSNFILLVERGYRLTFSLNTDNSEVDEPWNPDVSQKILSVYFSSLSLRSEYLSCDTKLNGFESLLMDEALAAFKGQKCLNLFENMHDRNRAKASPDCLISICNGIKGYRKTEMNDKVILLSSNYYYLHLMEAIFDYNAAIDGWGTPENKHDRRDAFVFNQFLHDGVVDVLETFPDRFRNDINTIVLVSLIIIFNADIPGLRHPEMIRHEQFSYIYLLRRYLRTICESDCEASDNHYRLMVKIEQLRLLAGKTKKDFFILLTEPVVDTITRAVTGQYAHEFHLQRTLDENYIYNMLTVENDLNGYINRT